MNQDKPTRHNIYYRLEASPFTFDTGEFTACFSSRLHLRKYREAYLENRDLLNYSLYKRFGMSITQNLLADLKLYMRIERRGFRIIYKGVAYTCLDKLQLNGGSLTLKS